MSATTASSEIGVRSQKTTSALPNGRISATQRDFDRKPGLADPGSADERHQGRQSKQFFDFGELAQPPDEAGHRLRQPANGGGTRSEEPWPDLREGDPIVDTELAEERRHVALDRADRASKPLGDLAVREPHDEQREDLAFALGHTRSSKAIRGHRQRCRPCLRLHGGNDSDAYVGRLRSQHG